MKTRTELRIRLDALTLERLEVLSRLRFGGEDRVIAKTVNALINEAYHDALREHVAA